MDLWHNYKFYAVALPEPYYFEIRSTPGDGVKVMLDECYHLLRRNGFGCNPVDASMLLMQGQKKYQASYEGLRDALAKLVQDLADLNNFYTNSSRFKVKFPDPLQSSATQVRMRLTESQLNKKKINLNHPQTISDPLYPITPVKSG